MIRTWRLDDGRQTLALASDGGVPWIVHWGAPLTPGEDLAELARAGAGDLSGGMLDALPPHAVVVNAGRGDTLDDAALVAALEQGRVAAAINISTLKSRHDAAATRRDLLPRLLEAARSASA